jgi:hypothetical protein
VITLIEHHHDHDVIAHQLTADDRHAAAQFIGDYLVPRIAAGWAKATDAELVYEIRRLHSQPTSELNTLLLNIVTDEQVRRAVVAAVTS